MAKNTFYGVKRTQGEQDPPNFDSVFTERSLLPRGVKKICGIRHFLKTGMGRLKHLRRLRRFSPTLAVSCLCLLVQHPIKNAGIYYFLVYGCFLNKGLMIISAKLVKIISVITVCVVNSFCPPRINSG